MNAPFAAIRYFGPSAHSSDDFEPEDADIAARAAYLVPLLAKSKADVAELLSTTTGTPAWDAFALALFDGDDAQAVTLAKALMVKAVAEEATRLAEAELWQRRSAGDLALLRRIGAVDVWDWLRARDA